MCVRYVVPDWVAWTTPAPRPGHCWCSRWSRTSPGSAPRSSPPGSGSPTGPYAATSRSCARPASRSSRRAAATAATGLGRGLRVPPLMFTATEALALVMAVLEGHDAADPEDPVGSALGKIVRVLPEPLARPVDAIRRVTARGWDVGVPGRRDDRRPGAGECGPATGPADLPARSGPRARRWTSTRGRSWSATDGGTCSGWSHTKDARRVLRVDRVARVRPASRDVHASRPTSIRSARSRSSCRRAGATRSRSRSTRRGPTWSTGCHGRSAGSRRWANDVPDSCATTDEPEWYAAQLAAQPFDFRVVDSPELRVAVDVLARRLRASVD